ncbi:MAG: diguanylate cyclase, partial [Rhodospirillales bacterium]
KGDQQLQTEVLKEIANRLQDNQRKSDTLAKLAGASFGIIAKTKADGEGLDILTGRIRDVLKDPVAVDDAEIDIATNVELEIFTLTKDSAESTTEKIRQRLQM